MRALRGLTWDHRRGFAPLEALGGPVRWDRQPLQGFESHPISDLASRYELLVIDHPGVGEAAEVGCLLSVEELFPQEELAGWRMVAVGRTFDSYQYGGKHWALPIDAAAQVCVARPDLLGDTRPPTTWEEVIGVSERLPICLSLAGPHALLTFFGICLALGEEPVTPEGMSVSEEVGGRALELLAALIPRIDLERSLRDPIDIHEAMATGDEVALCPLVFGYAVYCGPTGGRRRPLAGWDAPAGEEGGSPGTVLGGTGMAVSRRAVVDDALLEYLRLVMSEDVQRQTFPSVGGQPTARSAWLDEEVDRAWGGFYGDTVRSVEEAWVRPRHPGYIAFQEEASARLRRALLSRQDASAVLEDLRQLYAASRPAG